MKKLVIAALTMTLVFSLTACGGNKENDTPSEPTSVESSADTESTDATESTDVADTETENTDTESGDTATDSESDVSAETAGAIMLNAFKELMADGTDYTSLELAEKLVANPIIQFMGGAMPVEPGFQSGFDNYEVTGFEEGAMFGPMMGSIPFVGYVFKLPADADADAFMTGLKDNANMRWQICVEAEEMIAEADGNTVFFLMTKKNLNEE
ncbi:MAG: hypothetical protein E7287_09445 [Lachnospiraceae bacterium]|nr:hypothetical protein [Lachnospiraceae bacterium]